MSRIYAAGMIVTCLMLIHGAKPEQFDSNEDLFFAIGASLLWPLTVYALSPVYQEGE